MVAAAIAGGVQGTLGAIQTIASSIETKKLMRQLKPFETPEEAYKILNASQSAAQQGYDPFTLSYLTGQVDRASSEALGAATRLGANPNDISSLLDQRMQGVMKIGAENHSLNMANFSRYLSSLDMIGKNKEAEWASEQNMIKDRLQAAAQTKAQGMQNIGGALNTAISLDASADMANLWKEKGVAIEDSITGGVGDMSASRVKGVSFQSTLASMPNLNLGSIAPSASANRFSGIPATNNYMNIRQAVQGLLPTYIR